MLTTTITNLHEILSEDTKILLLLLPLPSWHRFRAPKQLVEENDRCGGVVRWGPGREALTEEPELRDIPGTRRHYDTLRLAGSPNIWMALRGASSTTTTTITCH